MKTIEEMTNNVFRRMQEYRAEKQRKRAQVRRMVIPTACCLCAMLVGFGAWQGSSWLFCEMPMQSEPSVNAEYSLNSSTNTSGSPTTAAQTTTEQTQSTQTQTTVPSTTVPSHQTVVDGVSPTPFIILYQEKAKAGATETVLQTDNSYLYNIYLEIVSTKGMTLAQKNALFEACVEKAKQYTYKYTGKSGGHCVHTTQDEYIVATAFTDLFRIKITDKQQFKQFRVYNTAKYGQIEVHGSTSPKDGRPLVMPQGKDVVVTKEMAEERGGYAFQELDVVSFTWEPTNDATKLMYGKDALDYTAFNDTIYIEVEYADGTKTTGSMDLVFDVSGKATVTCSNYNLVMQ